MALNLIVLEGRLVADPELRKTASDISVTSFCIAVDRDYRKGEETQADFINVTAWRGTADFIAKYFHKGSPILITGSLQSRQYEDKEGKKRTAFEVVADKAKFTIGGKSENAGATATKQDNSWDSVLDDDDDLPFN